MGRDRERRRLGSRHREHRAGDVEPGRRPGCLAHLEVLDEQSRHDVHRGEGTRSVRRSREDPVVIEDAGTVGWRGTPDVHRRAGAADGLDGIALARRRGRVPRRRLRAGRAVAVGGARTGSTSSPSTCRRTAIDALRRGGRQRMGSTHRIDAPRRRPRRGSAGRCARPVRARDLPALPRSAAVRGDRRRRPARRADRGHGAVRGGAAQRRRSVSTLPPGELTAAFGALDVEVVRSVEGDGEATLVARRLSPRTRT